MEKNTGKGFRKGAVGKRSQFEHNGNWIKRDTETGKIIDQKTSSNIPFKGVTKEK